MKTSNTIVTAGNIDNVIRAIRQEIKHTNEFAKPSYVYFPKKTRTDEIDRCMYRGKGRPRRIDYVYEDTLKLLKDYSESELGSII